MYFKSCDPSLDEISLEFFNILRAVKIFDMNIKRCTMLKLPQSKVA